MVAAAPPAAARHHLPLGGAARRGGDRLNRRATAAAVAGDVELAVALEARHREFCGPGRGPPGGPGARAPRGRRGPGHAEPDTEPRHPPHSVPAGVRRPGPARHDDARDTGEGRRPAGAPRGVPPAAGVRRAADDARGRGPLRVQERAAEAEAGVQGGRDRQRDAGGLPRAHGPGPRGGGRGPVRCRAHTWQRHAAARAHGLGPGPRAGGRLQDRGGPAEAAGGRAAEAAGARRFGRLPGRGGAQRCERRGLRQPSWRHRHGGQR
mmetsp:Transcript_64656/g.181924  ORF Transcript_64656/g.181924 Transcript_64656/m.181924 type:complete len:265 (-) Transcript_64656:913-1707(-)